MVKYCVVKFLNVFQFSVTTLYHEHLMRENFFLERELIN